MAIRQHRGPKHGASKALEGFQDRSVRYPIAKVPSTDARKTINTKAIAAPPLPLYRLTLQQAMKANLLRNLRVAEWWYLILHFGQYYLVKMKKSEGSTGRQWRFLSISRGHIVDTILAVTNEANQRWGHYEKATAEPRILDIPALAFRALWLHRAGHNHLIALSEFHGQTKSASHDIVRYIRHESARMLQVRQRSSHLRMSREQGKSRFETSIQSQSVTSANMSRANARGK